MFCELGYERVSLRNISERAGVSHSLIRHHFGSKENIWYAVDDALHRFITDYIQRLIADLPQDVPAKIQFYQFVVRLLALLLVEPKPAQFIADAVRQEGKIIDYFLNKHGNEELLLASLREKYENENPQQAINILEIKWMLVSSAHAAASLKPMLDLTWKEQTSAPGRILYNHWNLFNHHMAWLLDVTPDEMLNPIDLTALLLPYECDISVC